MKLTDLVLASILLNCSAAFAAVRYVDLNSPSPTSPYTNWATAATVIQDAVDAAGPGDQIVVTNGTYAAGGRPFGTNLLANRVLVDKAVTLRSVNGPEFTVIEGYQVPVTTFGETAVRCLYLTSSAAISGFTLTNGATLSPVDGISFDDMDGGGVICDSSSAVVSNCVLIGNSAWGRGGGAFQGTLNGCRLAVNYVGPGNYAGGGGGGAFGCTLEDCFVIGNSAPTGGGTAQCTMDNCVLSGNSALGSFCFDCSSGGGGTYASSLSNCRLSGNRSYAEGGGACGSYLTNCTLQDNAVFGLGVGYMGNYSGGGGAAGSTLYNCVVSGNSADEVGGGVDFSTLYNCTVTANAALFGGGAYYCWLTNCIVYYNKGLSYEANYDVDSFLAHCCTTPLPSSGIDNILLSSGGNNITAEPQLASASHISAGSPCRGAGDRDYSIGVDIDGEPWSAPASIGCDEFYPGRQAGSLTVAILSSFTNVATGFAVDLTARITGNVSASRWDFGDGTVMTNRPFATHAWQTAGDYSVVLRAYNQSYPDGLCATAVVQVVAQPVHYVSVASTNPVPPYASWKTAATTIQEAVDAASLPGSLVLVSNGVYETGGRSVYGTMTNRIAVTKALTLLSLNGPGVTAIRGYQLLGTTNGDGAIRCVYLTNRAALVGFTLTGGATRTVGDSGDVYREQSGGGVFCGSATALVSNCVLTSNSAGESDLGGGGGAFGGTLVSCTIASNSLTGFGGGCHSSVLYSCVITGNNASYGGGGAAYSAANDCLFSSNSGYSGGGAYGCTLVEATLSNNSASYGGGASSGSHNLRGTLLDCVLVNNSASAGGGAFTCTLRNCTLSRNRAVSWGGGAVYCTLEDCTLTGNSAGEGGGVNSSTSDDCLLLGNTAQDGGGGAAGGTLNNCTLVANSAVWGGGAAGLWYYQPGNGLWATQTCVLNNCIVYYNTATNGANFGPFTILQYCCSTPEPTNGFGNSTNDPRVVDLAGGNLHLQSDSPCINAGRNSHLTNSNFANFADLDGNPRVVGGTVDIGAYEFQTPTSLISYGWLQYYGLPLDGTADYTDPDGDGLSNWQEWRCGTNPTNALSALRLLPPINERANLTVTWQSVAGVNYFLERSPNLATPSAFTPMATNIPGQSGTTTYIDTNAPGGGPWFYRVGVSSP